MIAIGIYSPFSLTTVCEEEIKAIDRQIIEVNSTDISKPKEVESKATNKEKDLINKPTPEKVEKIDVDKQTKKQVQAISEHAKPTNEKHKSENINKSN